MAIIEIRTDDGQVIDAIRVNDVTEPLDNGRVWALAQSPLGALVVRRVEMAHAIEMGHPTGSRTAFVEDGEEPWLHTGRDRGRLDGKTAGELAALTADVTFPEPNAQLLEQLTEAVEAGWASRRDGIVHFDREGPLAVWDEDDVRSRPLFVLRAPEDASGATVYAPDCGDLNEFERRIYRDLADDAQIDDASIVERPGKTV